MNLSRLWAFLKYLLAPPTFPDKDKTLAARWLNFLLLLLITLLLADSIGIVLGILDQDAAAAVLVANFVALSTFFCTLLLMRRGHVKIGSLLVLTILFVLTTYTNGVVFHSIRTPAVMTYFALIPLAGLLLERRSMNIFAAICVLTILTIFYLEWSGILLPVLSQRSIFDDLVVLLIAVALNTALLNASIRRVEENAEEIRQTAAALAMANQELQLSQAQLQQARAELEIRVEQRTEELKQSNLQLQEGIEVRQRLVEALRKSEANWRSLAENVPEVIALINYDYTISFINRAVNNRLPETLIGIYAAAVHTQVVYQALLSQNMQRVFRTGETVSYESEEQTEQGTAWFINRVGAIKQDGKVVALILISTDITEQKQTEAAMYQAQKLESLGVMAGGVAHDFNNLLTAMLMQMSFAATQLPPDHPISPHIQRTIKAAERAAELTRQMLNYTGRSPSETKPVDLNDLITDNIHLFSAAISKNVALEPQLLSSIPLIMGDRGQIQQLIMNLILNGADAIGQKAGLITVRTDIYELTVEDTRYWRWTGTPLPSGQYVRLQVSDTGQGMDEKTLKKIFDPFFTTKFTGRGLGLASVLGIVRSHKGGLHVSSVVGEGTTFTILFPARTEVVYATTEAAITAPVNLQGKIVLVIDDEEMVRETMADILTAAGLHVLQAADGPSGIQLFRQWAAELKLVLLDLSMPGMSGEEVFYELRSINPQVPILLISGYSEHEIVDRFINKGLAGFIPKPYTMDSLLRRLQPHLLSIPLEKNGILSANRRH